MYNYNCHKEQKHVHFHKVKFHNRILQPPLLAKLQGRLL